MLVSNIIEYIQLYTTFYIVDCCIIPHFDNHLTRAAHFMSYLHYILNLG